MDEDPAFREWGRAVVDATADRLVGDIAAASVGSRSSLEFGYEARYVHFHDSKLPQPLCVWVYSSLAGGANNFRGSEDIIGIGLKHDANNELDRGEWRFRLRGSRFRWREHCDTRYAGFRLIEPAVGLRSQDVDAAAEAIAQTVLTQLDRAEVLPR